MADVPQNVADPCKPRQTICNDEEPVDPGPLGTLGRLLSNLGLKVYNHILKRIWWNSLSIADTPLDVADPSVPLRIIRDDGTVFDPGPLGTFGILLPELRHLVYSYILLGENVKQPPVALPPPDRSWESLSRAHHYKFDLRLMLVCRAMYSEAKRYLCSNNAFVLIEYEFPRLLDRLLVQNVPLVSHWGSYSCEGEGRMVKLSEWSLKIEFRWPGYGTGTLLGDRPLLEGNLVDGSANEGYLLLMFQDLAVWHSCVRSFCMNSLPDCVYIQEQPFDPSLPTGMLWKTLLHTRIEVRGRGHSLVVPVAPWQAPIAIGLHTSQESTLLQQLQTITGIGYYLEAVGFSDSVRVEKVKKTTSPNVIWARAFEDARLRNTQRLLELLRGLVSAGVISFAQFDDVSFHDVHRHRELPDELNEPFFVDAQRLYLREYYDLCRLDCRLNTLQQILGYRHGASHSSEHSGQWLRKVDIVRLRLNRDSCDIQYHHLRALCTMDSMMAKADMSLMSLLEQIVADLKNTNGWDLDPYISIDVPLIESFIEWVKVVSKFLWRQETIH